MKSSKKKNKGWRTDGWIEREGERGREREEEQEIKIDR